MSRRLHQTTVKRHMHGRRATYVVQPRGPGQAPPETGRGCARQFPGPVRSHQGAHRDSDGHSLPQRFISRTGAAWSVPKEPGPVHVEADAELSASCQNQLFVIDESGVGQNPPRPQALPAHAIGVSAHGPLQCCEPRYRDLGWRRRLRRQRPPGPIDAPPSILGADLPLQESHAVICHV